MSPRWRTLSISDESLPPLLIKAHLHSEGYTIHLTDLSRIWSESLTKREINKRALNNDCSIDPTDGPEQYTILLEKINGTLVQEDGTSLRFRPGDTEHRLKLELQAPLPHPLSPLNWTVDFSLQESGQLNDQLITPLFHRCHEFQAQTRLLMHALHEKDRVISKLCDRLEASGNDLSIPFPQTNGKLNRKSKRSHREQLAPFVRGLGDFDEGDWRKQWEQMDRSEERLEDGVLEGVTKGLKVAVGDQKVSCIRADWWRRVGSEVTSAKLETKSNDIASGGGSQTPVESKETLQESPGSGGETENDEFQRQSTSPVSKRSAATFKNGGGQDTQLVASSFTQEREEPTKVATEVSPDDESTEDEEDLDAPAKKPSQPATADEQATSLSKHDVAPKRTLGAIGGGVRQEPPTRTPAVLERTPFSPSKSTKTAQSPPSTIQPRPRLGAIGGKRDSGSSASTHPEHARPPSSSSSVQAPAERTAVSREPSAFNSVTPYRPSESSPAISEDEAAAPKKPAKLGTIGGRKPQGRPQAPTELASAADSQYSTMSPRKSKMGTIGGRSKVVDADGSHDHMHEDETRSGDGTHGDRSHANDGELDRARKQQRESTPPPRETSREKADRKRLELKRQLESGKNGGATKKKRKF
ncbi:hypothetical protein D0869_00113 [Hortaea werneckii]|uniref:Non-homologous end-joining factor 1 n=1 Tax=Hortaea werneckii TaxID=91943 RepID=A0A3M6XHY9_HORWE|nr:hypothetical protein KC324_g4309 [Hortaea werneckii]KAI7593436.1 hypothetical protein KC316_g1730 [Hortaea werneckii]RMX90473.1 hypothetical protein D0869_00113 [Hortaea werneckii]RMY16615.1 hypothetical protein D0868_00212 [Hortaea werneckii]